MSEDVQYQRLLWRCRRGALELDILLGDWLRANYRGLNSRQRAALERLLEYPDPDLMDWLSRGMRPSDPELVELVLSISALRPL